jgi:PKD repeat protein
MKTKNFIFAIIIFSIFFSCDKQINSPNACFTFNYEGEEIWETYLVFSNCSENASSYYWDFGDSTYSTEENPTHYYCEDGAYAVELTAYNGDDSDKFLDTVLVNWTQADKPNIYLYPDSTINISVELEFPKGGEVIKSIPDYSEKWCVSIDSLGVIDEEYDYLFYESIQPDDWQYKTGWCIRKDSLKGFFETNMKSYNFSEKEIMDFTSYWIPKLTDNEYFKIYPQSNSQIDKLIQLNLSIQPDNTFRLFYGIIGSDEYVQINEPEMDKINRNGFFVVEWGVFLK